MIMRNSEVESSAELWWIHVETEAEVGEDDQVYDRTMPINYSAHHTRGKYFI